MVIIFSERLRNLREEKGLTQQELAEKLKIGRASISNYELGTRTPDIEVLSKLADFFGVTTDYLIGKSDFRTWEEEMKFHNYSEKYLLEGNPLFEKHLKNRDKEKRYYKLVNSILIKDIEPLIKEFINFLSLSLIALTTANDDNLFSCFNNFIHGLTELFNKFNSIINDNSLDKSSNSKINMLKLMVAIHEDYVKSSLEQKKNTKEPLELLSYLHYIQLEINNMNLSLSTEILQKIHSLNSLLMEIYSILFVNITKNNLAAYNHSLEIINELENNDFSK